MKLPKSQVTQQNSYKINWREKDSLRLKSKPSYNYYIYIDYIYLEYSKTTCRNKIKI